MRKIILLLALLLNLNAAIYGATLKSLDKNQITHAIIDKTLISIATDNLNGKTIDNTFSMYLDGKGNIFGRMSHKPANEPQTDKGTYTINNDGSFNITWEHWDGARKLCGYFFETDNAYISIDCQNIFHTVFMKEAIKSGNHLYTQTH